MNGELAILNVSAGDTKLTFDPKNKAETKRAREVVTDMLKRGFCILVEAGRDEKGPLYRRVQKFDPTTDEYVVAGAPEEAAPNVEVPSGATPRKAAGRKGRKTSAGVERFDARRSKAVAIAPTAGG